MATSQELQFIELTLPAGVITEMTQFAAQGRYVDGNLIRFRNGQPQQIGGWTPLSGALTIDGVSRQMWAWRSLDGGQWLAIGTNRRLYVINGGLAFDVTPYRTTTTLTNPFSVTSGSATVTTAWTSHGLNTGDVVFFSGTTTANGVTINGAYIVVVIDANTFSFQASTTANATVSGFGGVGVAIAAYIPSGPADQTTGSGYGTFTFGSGTWGTPTAGGVPLDIAQWSFQNWGEDLIANRFAQGIYHWVKSTGTSTVAAIISQAPQTANHVLVTTDRIMVAYGCSDAGATTNFDPLSIKWSTQGDFTNWTPSATNTAGFFRINTGNYIVTARQVSDNILIWTDLDVYVQQPLPAPLVFGFIQQATGCGPISKNAVAVQSAVAFWMGKSQFYTFNAGVRPIRCDVLRKVFDNINQNQVEKIFAAVNSSFNEVTWYYPSVGSVEVDSYVTYNYAEDCWYYGNMVRTAAIDVNVVTPQNPLAIDANSTVWVHESGDLANTSGMPSFLLSSPIDIEAGNEVAIINRCIPDFAYRQPNVNVNLTFTGLPYPLSSETFTKGPYTVTENTRKIDFRLRARQVQYLIQGTNGFWLAGRLRLALGQDGYR